MIKFEKWLKTRPWYVRLFKSELLEAWYQGSREMLLEQREVVKVSWNDIEAAKGKDDD